MTVDDGNAARGSASRDPDTDESRETDGRSVGNLELFFDLTFVFAMSQVTHLMLSDISWQGFGRGVLALLALWWAWVCYACALLRGATATMRRLVANELNRSPALLVLDLSGVIRIDTEGIDAVVSAATQARRIRYLALPRRGARTPCRDRPRRCRTVGAL